MSKGKMTHKQSTVDMLKKLSQSLETKATQILPKRKSNPIESPKCSPIKTAKKQNMIDDANTNHDYPKTTEVNLLKAQENEQERRRSIYAAKLFLQQVEEEDFELNHPMLHDKYNELYSLENINAKMLEWKQSVLQSKQQLVETINKHGKKRKIQSNVL